MSQTPSLATWYAGFGSRKDMRVFGGLWQFFTILKPQTIGDYTLVRSAPWYTNPFTTRYSSAPCPRSPPEESILIVTVVNSSISPTKCIHLVFSDVKEFFIKYLLHCIYCDSFSSTMLCSKALRCLSTNLPTSSCTRRHHAALLRLPRAHARHVRAWLP